MFSKGQHLFALVFFITFVLAMIWAYGKDKIGNTAFYKGSYKILLFALLVFFTLFGIVKLKYFLFP